MSVEERTLEERLNNIEAMLVVLTERQKVQNFYEVEEFARLVGKSNFTCREWCRLGRIRADKKLSGRGAYARWVVAHGEWLRYQKEGLLPVAAHEKTRRELPRRRPVTVEIPRQDK